MLSQDQSESLPLASPRRNRLMKSGKNRTCLINCLRKPAPRRCALERASRIASSYRPFFVAANNTRYSATPFPNPQLSDNITWRYPHEY